MASPPGFLERLARWLRTPSVNPPPPPPNYPPPVPPVSKDRIELEACASPRQIKLRKGDVLEPLPTPRRLPPPVAAPEVDYGNRYCNSIQKPKHRKDLEDFIDSESVFDPS